MKNLEKFNAGTTPLGTQLITRDGREVSEWYYFKNRKSEFKVVYFVEDRIFTCQADGYHLAGPHAHANGLFIKPKVKECWINVYMCENGKMWVGDSHNTKQQAIDNKADGDYIKTIRITDEPE